MKRFYTMVSMSGEADGGFSIRLDGKPVRTPSGHILRAPTESLAQGIVQEWAVQDKDIVPDTMPLTQILTTAIDRVIPERAVMEQMAKAYLDTDLLLYQIPPPSPLAERQNAAWGPWRDWFRDASGSSLTVTDDLKAVPQPRAAHDFVESEIAAMDDMVFSVAQLITVTSGSIVLALAMVARAATPDDVYNAANVEEDYRAEIYNEALHGAAPQQEKQQAMMKGDLLACRDFLDRLTG